MRACAALLIVVLVSCRPEGTSNGATAKAPAGSNSATQAEVWSDIGVATRTEAEWLVVRKVGWQSGPEALFLSGSDPEAKKLQASLVGNRRLDYLCGYHWSVDFSFPDGRSESVLINEDCESFERNGKEVMSLLSGLFERARNHPSHYLLRVIAGDAKAKANVRHLLERTVGPTLDPDPTGAGLFVASTEPWSAGRAEAVKSASPDIVKIEHIPVVDMGT